jgi:hypothetical protein
MFARKSVFSSIGRTAALVTVAALALTAVEPSMARAGSAPAGKGLTTATSDATDFSARRRYYRHYGRGGGGAAAAAFAGIVGTGLAIAATQNRRAYYDDYYGGPGYGYYGGGPYYGGGYGYRRGYGW